METLKSKTSGKRRSLMSNHETFPLRYAWIYKGLTSIKNQTPDFDDPNAHHELGIGINMLKSMGYWMQATRLASFTHVAKGSGNPFKLTELGAIISDFDPYLEDVGTIWVLQFELATNNVLAPLWYWIFNIARTRLFNDEIIIQGLTRYLEDESRQALSPVSVKRDIRCFRRSYIPSILSESKSYHEDLLDCPLSELNLIKESSSQGTCNLNIGNHPTLPLELFEYACWRYKEIQESHNNTPLEEISAGELKWNPGSPGRIFCLDGSETESRLDLLNDNRDSSVTLDSSEGINLVKFGKGTTANQVLEQYYSN